MFHQYLQKFPQQEKYILGQKIESLILETLEFILLAAKLPKEKKYDVLQKAALKTDLLKILTRLATEIRALDSKKYIQLQQKLQEIGKMTGGWIKSIVN